MNPRMWWVAAGEMSVPKVRFGLTRSAGISHSVVHFEYDSLCFLFASIGASNVSPVNPEGSSFMSSS